MKKYNPKEREAFAGMFTELVLELEQHKFADVLGELYMGLELSSKWKGQFFTPYHVSSLMAKMSTPDNLADEINKKGYYVANDPSCGSGVMLIAFAEHCHEQEINFQQSVWFVAQDVDPVVAHMCYIQMSLLGMPGEVIIGNTLTCDYSNYDRWYTMMGFSPAWQYRQQVERLKNFIRNVGTVSVSTVPEAPQEISTNVITLGQVEQLDLFAEAV
jgi:type I restriction-modification system DNA methylase subunit